MNMSSYFCRTAAKMAAVFPKGKMPWHKHFSLKNFGRLKLLISRPIANRQKAGDHVLVIARPS